MTRRHPQNSKSPSDADSGSEPLRADGNKPISQCSGGEWFMMPKRPILNGTIAAIGARAWMLYSILCMLRRNETDEVWSGLTYLKRLMHVRDKSSVSRLMHKIESAGLMEYTGEKRLLKAVVRLLTGPEATLFSAAQEVGKEMRRLDNRVAPTTTPPLPPQQPSALQGDDLEVAPTTTEGCSGSNETVAPAATITTLGEQHFSSKTLRDAAHHEPRAEKPAADESAAADDETGKSPTDDLANDQGVPKSPQPTTAAESEFVEAMGKLSGSKFLLVELNGSIAPFLDRASSGGAVIVLPRSPKEFDAVSETANLREAFRNLVVPGSPAQRALLGTTEADPQILVYVTLVEDPEQRRQMREKWARHHGARSLDLDRFLAADTDHGNDASPPRRLRPADQFRASIAELDAHGEDRFVRIKLCHGIKSLVEDSPRDGAVLARLKNAGRSNESVDEVGMTESLQDWLIDWAEQRLFRDASRVSYLVRLCDHAEERRRLRDEFAAQHGAPAVDLDVFPDETDDGEEDFEADEGDESEND